ncbi:MAG: hypothetical protein ACOC1F_08845, partial [Myxococcota bacterium]
MAEARLPVLPLPPSWLLHDDGDLVVACKPEGVSVSASDGAVKHDLMARVRAARNDPGYLCPHVHL